MNGRPMVRIAKRSSRDRPNQGPRDSKGGGVSPALSRRFWLEVRGTAIVESALILLFFFTLIIGIFEMSRFFSVQQTLTDAAREGARYAVTPLVGTETLPTEAAVRGWTDQFLASNGLSAATVTVNIVDPDADGIDVSTEVVVSMPYQVLTAALFDDLEVTVRGRSRMRNENSL